MPLLSRFRVAIGLESLAKQSAARSTCSLFLFSLLLRMTLAQYTGREDGQLSPVHFRKIANLLKRETQERAAIPVATAEKPLHTPAATISCDPSAASTETAICKTMLRTPVAMWAPANICTYKRWALILFELGCQLFFARDPLSSSTSAPELVPHPTQYHIRRFERQKIIGAMEGRWKFGSDEVSKCYGIAVLSLPLRNLFLILHVFFTVDSNANLFWRINL